uniref:Uncharacterized protein n=1 Tax=Molossus molossus TaxID=27622 RepID=A0A7J8HZQ3_MOLMO|nr:hypothetical protein HJG59_010772 [Molossus molossus]
MIKIRILFLEICNSFSEIRRDLWSSYFYCKSNSLEKIVICRKALFSITAPCEVEHTVHRAAAGGEGAPRGKLGRARSVLVRFSTVSLGLSGHHAGPLAPWAQQHSSVLLLPFGRRTPRGPRGQQSGRADACGLVHAEETVRWCWMLFPRSTWVGLCPWPLELIRPSGLQSLTGVPSSLRGHLDPASTQNGSQYL